VLAPCAAAAANATKSAARKAAERGVSVDMVSLKEFFSEMQTELRHAPDPPAL
jgi:undecaprenyl pyrophosphate synthase